MWGEKGDKCKTFGRRVRDQMEKEEIQKGVRSERVRREKENKESQDYRKHHVSQSLLLTVKGATETGNTVTEAKIGRCSRGFGNIN